MCRRTCGRQTYRLRAGVAKIFFFCHCRRIAGFLLPSAVHFADARARRRRGGARGAWNEGSGGGLLVSYTLTDARRAACGDSLPCGFQHGAVSARRGGTGVCVHMDCEGADRERVRGGTSGIARGTRGVCCAGSVPCGADGGGVCAVYSWDDSRGGAEAAALAAALIAAATDNDDDCMVFAGTMAIQSAAMAGNIDVLRVLLESDKFDPSADGEYALSEARIRGHGACAALLEAVGSR